jgi:Rrf2 family protein
MFSQTVEYALRTVVWLAAQDGEPRTTQQIARATKIPAGYLAKILQTLGRARLVNSQRGMKGGFTLALAPEKLSPWDVIVAIDPVQRIEKCPLGLKSHSKKLCPFHRRMDHALGLLERELRAARISELHEGSSKGKPFCG